VIEDRLPAAPCAAEVPESSLVSLAESETVRFVMRWYTEFARGCVRLVLYTQRFQPYTFVAQELTENARMNRPIFGTSLWN